jgi:hypothetical protein
MSETENNNFHEFALQTVLFKGRPDLYFCYLKSEKIAFALRRLLEHAPGHSVSESLSRGSAHLPSSIVRFAAQEIDEFSLLADVFELLSLTRLCVSENRIEEGNARILIGEFESMAKKISVGKNASPFLSLEDLAVPPLLPPEREPARLSHGRTLSDIKDNKGQNQGHIVKETPAASRERTSQVLKIVLELKRVSIKDISKVIRGCSEKTIQRELNVLISQGLVRKEGDRRWSVYVATGKEA